MWLFCRSFFGFRFIFGQVARNCQIDAILLPFDRHKC
jgi:hypothetical protein